MHTHKHTHTHTHTYTDTHSQLTYYHVSPVLTNISTQFLLQSVCVCVCSILFYFFIILYVNCFGRTMLYMCIEYHVWVNMCHVSVQGVDERMINVHYYYYSREKEKTRHCL